MAGRDEAVVAGIGEAAGEVFGLPHRVAMDMVHLVVLEACGQEDLGEVDVDAEVMLMK